MPTVRTDANGGFAFVHIPRTGGIAIAGALLERAGFREVVGRTDSGDYAHHHARASEAGPCARIACVVRHPLERLVSAFITAAALNLHAYAPTREGLDAFCRDAGNSPPTGVFFLPMTHFTQGRVTIVARFEAWDAACTAIVGEPIDAVVNRNALSPFEAGPVAREAAHRWYADDFATFGYPTETTPR